MKSKGYKNYKIDDERENALILHQILSTILKRNVWRSGWKTCMWILGLKGLIVNHLYKRETERGQEWTPVELHI